MDLTSLILFNLTLLAALASPGPALLCALRASLSGGRLQGVLTGAGLATMAALWTLLALLGLDAVFVMVPWAYTALKILGALYLLRLAWQAWVSADEPVSMAPTRRRRAFSQGLLVNLANPKSVLFAAAVLVVIFPAGLTGAERLLIITNHLVVELVAYSLLATVFSTRVAETGYLKAKRWLDRGCALVMGTLGLRLLFDQR